MPFGDEITLFQTGNRDHLLICLLTKIKWVLDPGPGLDPYSGGCDLAEWL